MTEYVLSIDPGLSTGIVLLSYEEDNPAELVEGWQFTGGVVTLADWVEGHLFHEDEALIVSGILIPWGSIIAEKFTARNTRGFSYTTASLEPLRGEGALIALGLMPDYTASEKRWRDPKYQYLVGGRDKADKKKRMHRFLKDNGFYRTGKDLDAADADDYRSAAAHGIVYIARELKHKPTFDMISNWEGD